MKTWAGLKIKPEQEPLLGRIQIGLWIGEPGAYCSQCGQEYLSIDDFIEREPRLGYGAARPMAQRFVDEKCWEAYLAGESK